MGSFGDRDGVAGRFGMVAIGQVQWQKSKHLLGADAGDDAGPGLVRCLSHSRTTSFAACAGLCLVCRALAGHRANLADGRVEGRAAIADGLGRLDRIDPDRSGHAGSARGSSNVVTGYDGPGMDGRHLAYFAGRKFGKNKLAPSISPSKTWEGVAGAMLGVAAYVLVAWSFSRFSFAVLPGLLVASWCWVGLAVFGDLFESSIKRQAGVKDSGALLPGHGGLLDRIDALTSTLPLAALALLLQHLS